MDLFAEIMSNARIGLILAIGLGLVIFVHELGHFAVAKWVGVLVERFSIGFGPILWSFRRGETEYAISAIPFGGYVKMLGQDDADPEQMVREEIRANPRSYPAQSVPKRMAIISAGVIMNLIFGFLFFLLVFNVGVPYTPPLVASIEPGGPAWQAGLERGDLITRVNNEEIIEFEQLQQAVVLSDPKAGLDVEVDRQGRSLTFHLVPDVKDNAPQIGVGPSMDLVLDRKEPVEPQLAAAKAIGEKFQGGDRIIQINDIPVENYPEFVDALAKYAAEEVRIRVRRASSQEEVEIQVPAQPMRDWGLHFQMGKVTAIRADSPASKAGIQVGDVIEMVAGEPCDPLRLPDLLAGLHDREVELVVKRESQGEETIRFTIVPEDKPGWITPPRMAGNPLTVPAIGVAYQLRPVITEAPRPGSPAEAVGLQKNDLVSALTLIVPPRTGAGSSNERKHSIDDEHPWLPKVFWELQYYPEAKLRFTVKREGTEVTTEAFSLQENPDWPAPFRGLTLGKSLTKELPPQGFTRAIILGYRETKSTITTIYLMLQRLLVSRTVSPKMLSGPVGIAEMGFRVASLDIRLFIKFLAMLSVNLAIINFLPIPVLDGGHMILLAWEGLRGKPASERVIIAANYCGLLLIICLALFVTFNDITRWIR